VFAVENVNRRPDQRKPRILTAALAGREFLAAKTSHLVLTLMHLVVNHAVEAGDRDDLARRENGGHLEEQRDLSLPEPVTLSNLQHENDAIFLVSDDSSKTLT
jgi:hypothetical protein